MIAVVFTLGCKVNSCESLSLISGLKNLGYEVYDYLCYADLYIINTCAVTAEAEKKSRQTLARARKFNENAKIIVTGCASEKSPNDFYGKQNVTLVTGAKAKEKILSLLSENGIKIEKDDFYVEEGLPVKGTRTRTYVKVQDGCNNFCSYCIIPYLRGRSRSRNYNNVIKEIEYIKPLEAVITGINLSAYNYNGITLTGLINSLSKVKCRIRLGSLEENIIDDEFLTACKNLYDFAPHFHLSLQSGSDKVLKEMNRHYNAEDYEKKCNLIREYFPLAAITTDIIVGYSTETEEDFYLSCKLAQKVRFADIHCFPYSKRSGTVGAKIKELPFDVVKNRTDKMLEVKKSLKNEFISKNINTISSFIPEEYDGEYTVGYTGNYIRVYVKENLLEKVYMVKIAEPFKDGAIGIIL